MKTLLTLQDVSFTYEGNSSSTLHKVSFEINPGECIGVLGPTGAGKTTLARLLSGVIPNLTSGKLSGNIYMEQQEIDQVSFEERTRKVGLVGSNADHQLFCTTVEEEIAFGLENLNIPRSEMHKDVESILKFFNLWNLRKRSPASLSGGEKQLVSIASILVMKPRIIILDEVTGNLDGIGTLRILKAINEIRRTEPEVSFIWITHKTDYLAEMATRCVLLNEGKIVLDAPRKEFFMQTHILSENGVKPPFIYRLWNSIPDTLRTQMSQIPDPPTREAINTWMHMMTKEDQ